MCARSPYHRSTEASPHLEFRILGRLEVSGGGRAPPLGGPMQRALLAALLLNANRVVPRDRLVDDLWDGAAPATVNAVVSTYVSRLRKLFEGDPDVDLVSEGRGYTLRLPPERLDARRFEELAAEGRSALAAGDAEGAGRSLHEGLALWKGPALADVAHRPFVRAEVARLDELRVAALEDRIDADLALGRHAEVVGELEALVVEHPYRERLRAQLILALYRSGRQAEALAAYRETRRTLVEQLGIEPSRTLHDLERKILRHDATLDAPAAGESRPADGVRVLPSRRTRPSWYALSGAVAAALVAALVYALAIRPGTAPTPVTLAGDSVAVVDADEGTVVGEISLGGRPGSVAAGEGSVWVGNRDERTIVEINPASRRVVRTIGLGFVPAELVFAAGSVWAADEYRGVVVRVDPTSGTVLARMRLGDGGHSCCPISLAKSQGTVWAARFGALSRIDVATNRVVPLRRVGSDVLSVAAGEEAVWALTPTHLLRIDARTGALANRIGFGHVGRSTDQYWLAAGGDAVWIGNKEGRTLWKLDPDEDRLVAIVPLGRIPRGIATGGGAVWVAGADATLVRVDPEHGRVVRTLRLGVYPPFVWRPVAVAAGRVWIAVTAI
jgi:DNA-binding SARP family transcriptional activator/streptogramin lyase